MGRVSPHSVNIQLPFEVPQVLFNPGGWSIAPSLGMGGIDPSTLHIPTTITISPLTLEPGIAEDAGEDILIRNLAVWPLVSGRVASGASVSVWFEPVSARAETVKVSASGLTRAMGDSGTS